MLIRFALCMWLFRTVCGSGLHVHPLHWEAIGLAAENDICRMNFVPIEDDSIDVIPEGEDSISSIDILQEFEDLIDAISSIDVLLECEDTIAKKDILSEPDDSIDVIPEEDDLEN